MLLDSTINNELWVMRTKTVRLEYKRKTKPPSYITKRKNQGYVI